jgi:hypothetical protein
MITGGQRMTGQDKPKRWSSWTVEIKVLEDPRRAGHPADPGAVVQDAALMGPFREPWEFGYLMVDPAKIDR